MSQPDWYAAADAAVRLLGDAGVNGMASLRLTEMLDLRGVQALTGFATADSIRNAVTFPSVQEFAAVIGMSGYQAFVQALRDELTGVAR